MLKRIKDFFFSDPEMTHEVYEGLVSSKEREDNPPRSTSIYISQSSLDVNYKACPDRYDNFFVTIGSKRVMVSYKTFYAIPEGRSVRLTIIYVKSDSLFEQIKYAHLETHTIEILKG